MPPELMYVQGDQKEKKYIEITKPVRVGFGSDCDAVLPRLECVDETHLIFYKDEVSGDYMVKNVGEQQVHLNHTSKSNKFKSAASTTSRVFKKSELLGKGESRVLGWKTWIMFGTSSSKSTTFLIWTNQDEVEPDEEPTESEQKYIKLPQEASKDVSLDVEINSLRQEIYRRLSKLTELNRREVSALVARFLVEVFPLSLVILYRKAGARWRPMATYKVDKSTVSRPSMTLFKKALQEHTPIMARMEDGELKVGDTGMDVSLSIVENPAKRFILYPLSIGSVDFGMLYMDSKEESLGEREFNKLSRLLLEGGVIALLSGYLVESIEDINSLKMSKDSLPRNWGFRFAANFEKTHTPLLVSKTYEDMGEFRFMYGVVGDQIEQVVKIKSFVEGIQINSAKGERHIYGVKQFIDKIAPDLEPALLDMCVEYPVAGSGSDVHRIGFEVYGMYVYANLGGELKELTAPGYNVTDMQIGDYLVITPFPSKNFLSGEFSIERFRRTIKDFLLLMRER